MSAEAHRPALILLFAKKFFRLSAQWLEWFDDSILRPAAAIFADSE